MTENKITNNDLKAAIDAITEISGVVMNPIALIDDVFLVSEIYNEPSTFFSAINQICRSLTLLIHRPELGTELVGNLREWRSYHFQSMRVRKHRADLRIVYKVIGNSIEIKGFGNRHLPSSIYERINQRKNP